MDAIERRFGSLRGAVRLALSYPEQALRLGGVRKPVAGDVRRLVFVCHGNICRSAYAEGLVRRLGVETASFGLSTHTGNPAHPPVVAEALARGLDLSAHRATDVSDYQPRAGDFLLAMETRHLRKIAGNPRLSALPRALLGAYAPWPFPHLHDPYKLSPAYLPVCLDRIDRAVAGLCKSLSLPQLAQDG